MKQQLQYHHIPSDTITVIVTQEFPAAVTNATLNSWQEDLQNINIVPGDTRSDVIAEDEDGFIPSGL